MRRLPEENELKDVIDYFSRIETAKLPGKSYVELKEILDSMKNEKRTSFGPFQNGGF